MVKPMGVLFTFTTFPHSRRRSGRASARAVVAALGVLWLVAGCQSPRPRAPQSPGPEFPAITALDYRPGFPDILDVVVAGQPESSGRFLLTPDGDIEPGKLGGIPVEGKTLPEIAQRIAEKAGVPVAAVDCRVSQARSRVIHVFGPAGSTPSTLPYTGAERVTEALVRAGISPLEHISEVTVIRRNTATGQPPETVRVNLPGINAGDPQTNIALEPNDEIHVQSPNPSLITRLLPDRLRLVGAALARN